MSSRVDLPWSNPPLTGNRTAFTVTGTPVTKSRARWNRKQNRAYTPKATIEAEARIRAEYLRVAKPAERNDAEHTFGIHATFYLPPGGVRKDVDNLLKLVMDGLTGAAWEDDSQVTEVFSQKIRLDAEGTPRTEVTLYRTGDKWNPNVGNCVRCSAEFPKPTSWAKRKYCSRACVNAANLERRAKKCENCEQTFHGHKSDQRFCSKECAYAYSHVDVTCAKCGAAFTKARSLNRRGNAYCSEECKATYWRDQRRCAAKGTCQDCGGPTTKKTYKRCRDCAYAAGGRWAPE